jgi:four helix bundle protein
MTIRRFEEIKAWQEARALTKMVYEITNDGSFARDFRLRDQIRDAAGSIMHNIAEGFGAGSDAEFLRFLRYARRSASEVQSQLYIALDQAYITDRQFHQIYNKADETKRLINGFVGYLKQPKKTQPNQLPKRPNDQTTKRLND